MEKVGRGHYSFNPLPPSKRGETSLSSILCDALLLFQSAPPVETRGDISPEPLDAGAGGFQSAPPVETRGDLSRAAPLVAPREFQSAPPVETRGDETSILNARPPPKFQSAPPVETRGDLAPSCH